MVPLRPRGGGIDDNAASASSLSSSFSLPIIPQATVGRGRSHINQLRQLKQHSLEHSLEHSLDLAPTAKPAARHAKVDSTALAKMASATTHQGYDSARTCTSAESSEWSTEVEGTAARGRASERGGGPSRLVHGSPVRVVASSVPEDAPPVRVGVRVDDEEADTTVPLATDTRTLEDLRRRLEALKSEPAVPLL